MKGPSSAILPRPGRLAIACAAYVGLHVASALVGQHFLIGPDVRVRHAQGLTLAFLVICGPRFIPLCFATSLGISLTLAHETGPYWLRIVLPAVYAVGYGAAAWVVRRQIGPAPIPRHRRESILFIFGALASPVPSALAGSLLLVATGLLPAAEAPGDIWLRWLVSSCSILTIVPAAAVHVAPWLADDRTCIHPVPPAPRWEVALEVASLLLLFCLIPLWARQHTVGTFCLCFAPLAWISLRHGLPGATLAILAINLGSYLVLGAARVSGAISLDYLLFSCALAVVGLGLGMAVTFRARAEAALAESEAMMARVVSGAKLGLWDANLATDEVVLNATLTEMIGYRKEEVPNKTGWWESLVHEEDWPEVQRRLQDHWEGRTPFYEAEYRLRTREGGWKWILARGTVVQRDRLGRPLRFSGTHLDLTERKRAEAEKGRLLEIIEAAPDFICTLDLNRRVLYANPALLRLRGLASLAEARGRPAAEFHSPVASKRLLEVAIPAALERGMWMGESALADPRKGEVPVSELVLVQRDDVGRPAFFSLIARDIADQRRAEAERLATERKMLEAQKLESLGVLSGGVAHDFNNLLTVMLGNASLARMDLPVGSAAAGHLEQIRTAAVRAAELCKQLLAYSGKGRFTPALVDVSALVEDTAQLLQVSISKKCVLKFDLGRDLPPVKADATQLRQILMNLVLNASDAIGERSGFIRAATGLMRADFAYLAGTYLAPDIPPGDYVWIEISDNGCGMSPEVKQRIFEPFFSTKFAGRGLGLSAVLGIVRGHRGALKVYSENGRGSTFRLLLPAAEGRAETPSEPGPAPARGTGTILVVDDEETVRTVAARLLESHGYETVLAADGREAVELFRRDPGRFRAVLLDLTMPHMDGEETFRELRKLRAEVPVVLMSGFSEKDSVDRFAGRQLAGFLAKPFDHESLGAKLRALLAAT